ncbi:MAG: SDR family NAD(P)-dependent oxidoreductase [Bacteroidia bacterium]
MQPLINKYGKWALITGASSGIGAEFAMQLAALNFNLVLVARRKEKLENLSAELIAKNNIETLVISLDLSKPDFLETLMEQTNHLDIGLLINNAGFAITGSFLNDQLENQLSLLDVNCKAPLILSHYFGNKMLVKGSGGIINIASTAAFLPLPYWSNYAASKAYLLSFSEGIWHELKDKGIDVLAVCPGPTQTEFASIANVNLNGMTANDVVNYSLKNIGKKSSVIVGFANQFSNFFLRFFSRNLLIKFGAIFTQKIAIN